MGITAQDTGSGLRSSNHILQLPIIALEKVAVHMDSRSRHIGRKTL